MGVTARTWARTRAILVGPSDYTQFSITAPRDGRLPDGGGYTISGLYDLNPNKVGQVSDLITFADNYGKMTKHWNGVDVSLSARPRNGLLVQGGVSTGREIADHCDTIAKLPEVLFASRAVGNRVGALPTVGYQAGRPAQFCHQNTGFQTQVKLLGSYQPGADDQQQLCGLAEADGDSGGTPFQDRRAIRFLTSVGIRAQGPGLQM